MRKKLFVLLLIIIVISALVYTRHILSRDTEEKEIPVIHLVEERRTPLFIPHYLAVNLGFFSEQNIDVKTLTVAKGKTTLQMLQEKEADVILAGPGQAVLTGPPRSGSSPVAFAEVTRRNGAFLMVRKLEDEFNWKDTERRTIISGPPTEDTSIILEYILRRNKVLPNWDVNVIENLPPYLRPGTFKSGTGSFLVVEEPDASRLEGQGVGTAAVSLGKEAGRMPAAVYISRPDYLDSHSQEVQKLVNGLYKAQQWMHYHSPAEIAGAVKNSFPQYDRSELISAVKRYKQADLWSPNPVIDKNSYQNLYRAVETSGELVNKVPFSKAVTNRFAKIALKKVHYVPKDKQKPKPGLNWRYIRSLFNIND
ncbi:MAG: ABC transporter substrate-binding protein [Desulfotomaculum sp.]|nr:ABC transporter substrate-binding protein [Desulfotomaculum sp.]